MLSLAYASGFHQPVRNAGYCSAKGLGIPVGQDTSKPTSPVSELQWSAGNNGAVNGLMPD